MKRNFKLDFLVGAGLLTSVISFSAEASANEASLPLTFTSGNPAPYGIAATTVTIDGTNYPLMVDTGAKKMELALTPVVVNKLHVKYTGKENCGTSVDGKVHCLKEFVIPEVKIGSFTLTNVKGSYYDSLWGGNDTHFKADAASKNGLIGFALLSKFNLVLDYPHARMILVKPGFKPKNYNIDHWVPIPFEGQLITTLNFDGKSFKVLWDTGSVPSIVKDDFAKNFVTLPCPNGAPYSQSNCRIISSKILLTTTNKTLPNNWFMIVKNLPKVAPFDGLMGNNFFAEHVVYIDFQKQIIYVKDGST